MSTEHVEALRKLTAEVGGLKAFEPGVREAIGSYYCHDCYLKVQSLPAAPVSHGGGRGE